MGNEEKETKRGRRQTTIAPPLIGNKDDKGDTATATTTSDRDHHRGQDVAESLAAMVENEYVDVVDIIKVVRLQPSFQKCKVTYNI